jgi:hypothetical protein
MAQLRAGDLRAAAEERTRLQEAAGDAAGAKVTKALFDKAWAGGTDVPQLAQL